MGAQLLNQIPFTRKETDTSGATIELNLNSRATMFTPSAVIAAAKAITIGGGISLFSEFKFRFTITNVTDILTWPSNVKMSDVFWNDVAKTWTPLNTGEWEASGAYDGTNWNVSIIGPYL